MEPSKLELSGLYNSIVLSLTLKYLFLDVMAWHPQIQNKVKQTLLLECKWYLFIKYFIFHFDKNILLACWCRKAELRVGRKQRSNGAPWIRSSMNSLSSWPTLWIFQSRVWRWLSGIIARESRMITLADSSLVSMPRERGYDIGQIWSSIQTKFTPKLTCSVQTSSAKCYILHSLFFYNPSLSLKVFLLSLNSPKYQINPVQLRCCQRGEGVL